MMLGLACLPMIVSGCVTTKDTIEIEDREPGKSSGLSLCDNVSRRELMYSRNDTQETKDSLGGVIEKYDKICGKKAGA